MGALQPAQFEDRQARVLAFIRQYDRTHGYGPSVRDIQEGCDLGSSSVADYHVRRLAEEGRIERDPGRARSIRLRRPVGVRASLGPCPLCGCEGHDL